MSSGGYIKLYRQLQESWVWTSDEKYSKGQAWVDLLLSANHKDRKILFDGEIVIISRGQFLTSLSKLAETWKWSRSSVHRFLELLERDKMINKVRNTNGTLITIVNYDNFQGCDNASETRTEHERNTNETRMKHGRNADETRTDTNNNVKNDNNEKNVKNNIPPIIPQGKKSKSAVATKEELEALLNETAFSDYLKDGIKGWLAYKREKGQSYKPMGFKQLLTKITNQLSIETEDMIVKDIEECMSRNYAGIFFGTAQKTANKGQQSTQDWIKMWEEA